MFIVDVNVRQSTVGACRKVQAVVGDGDWGEGDGAVVVVTGVVVVVIEVRVMGWW